MNLRNGKLTNSAHRFPNEGTARKWSLRLVQGEIRIPHKGRELERQILRMFRLLLKERRIYRVRLDRDRWIVPRLYLKIMQQRQGLFQFQCRLPHLHPQVRAKCNLSRQMLQISYLPQDHPRSNGDQTV